MPKIGLAAVLLIGAVVATGCGSQSSAHARTELRTTAQSNAGLPSTSAGRQLAWALALVNSGRTPTAAELAAHYRRLRAPLAAASCSPRNLERPYTERGAGASTSVYSPWTPSNT